MDAVPGVALQTVTGYRPDIDGLRAVAIAAVVLYHARGGGWAGGYVGVDVFFVISGFLITSQLAGTEPKRLRMGLGAFYLRRARRILPAMLLTALIVTAAALVILLPWDLTRFGKYLAAAAVAATNLTATTDADYFDAGALDAPLLHYWSLAVEEQFYLLYPAALLMIGRWLPRHRLPTLAALAGASLLLWIVASSRWPIANFYLMPTRGWELLLGGLVALSPSRSGRRPASAQLAAACSLLALMYAVYAFGSPARHPGTLTVLPCVATAMLILTGRDHRTWVGRLLSQPLLVFTGRISYALYLWHLPVLVLFTYYHIEEPSAFELLLLLILTYALATASWLLIESPVHHATLLRSTRVFVGTCAFASALALGTGLWLWRSNGLPQRFSPEVVALASVGVWATEAEQACRLQLGQGRLCRYGPAGDEGTVAVVWGDSHALMLVPIYQAQAQARHLRLYVAGRAACRPLLGVASLSVREPWQRACAQFNETMVRAIDHLNPRLVVLNAHWIDTEHDLQTRPGVSVPAGESKLHWALQRTLQRIHRTDRIICILEDVPTFRYDVPYALAVARRRAIDTRFLGLSADQARSQFQEAEAEFTRLQGLGLLRVVDPKDDLCRGGSCAFEADGKSLYRDTDHLSLTGAEFIAPSVGKCFDGLG